jgi:hypothetical protein
MGWNLLALCLSSWFLVMLIIAAASLVASVYGFGKEGHDAVGATAMSGLDSASSSKIKAILGGEDASDVAGWAHRIEESLKWTSGIHFLPQITDWECKAPDAGSPGVCPDGRCLSTGIRHFYRQLTHGPEVKGVNVMKTDTDFTDADALRFLINLVGDISQPLHVGFKSDNFGKSVYVEIPEGFQGHRQPETVTLSDLWETVIIDSLINNPYNPNFWWSGWTHVRNIHPTTFEIEKKRWADKGIDAISDWVQDNVEFVCNMIYTDPATKARFAFSTDKSSPTKLSFQTLLLWQQLIKDRILIGGGRLGIMLVGMLKSEDGVSVSKLRRGSAVEDPKPAGLADLANVFDDVDDRQGTVGGVAVGGSKHMMGYSAGMRNIGIILGVAAAVVLYLIFTSKLSTNLQNTKSHIIEMVGPHGKRVISDHKD